MAEARIATAESYADPRTIALLTSVIESDPELVDLLRNCLRFSGKPRLVVCEGRTEGPAGDRNERS